MERRTRKLAAAAFGLAVVAGVGIASSKDCCWQTREPAQIVGDTDNTEGCWDVVPLVTIGEQTASGDDVNAEKIGYMAPGLLDGIGAWKWSKHTVRVLVNSEYGAGDGHAYELANGTEVKGARISYFDIDAKSR
ncbi:MAG TPA: hypothetical protein VFY93_17030, partial [Planctomycetota bacterium]|nr:hypothetical protein [Planctomycetota bacterium]